ncbi:MAG: RluA family pseudouridine synthase [Bacteroidia bacterium]|nr:RluA family pseudouridine synthase [Bacteroidia bacterium]
MLNEEYIDEVQEDDDLNGRYEHFRFTADPGQSLVRIDKFLTDRILNVSRTRMQAAADAGNLEVNGKVVKANYRVKPNDVVVVMLDYPPRDTTIIPQDIPIDIVYEDDDLLVVNKAAGMVVHPGHGNFDGTLLNALAYHFGKNNAFDASDPRLGLVHRIDKDTSGLLLIAKNPFAKMFLSQQFFHKTTDRLYQALVWGTTDAEGTIVGNIGRSTKDRLQMAVFPEGNVGKPAVTHYKLLENFHYVSLVECKLETGRTHQIRAHMKYIGHPLFNDVRYGGDQILKGTTFAKYKQFIQNCFNICPRQALHAKTLGFEHPTTHERMYFNSELPDDMKNLLDKWRNYTTCIIFAD